MSALRKGERVVAVGTFLYAGSVECALRIVESPICYGSGDYEDEPEVANDTPVRTYYVQFNSSEDPNHFNSALSGYPSLAEARASAEQAAGIGPTVRWRSGAI